MVITKYVEPILGWYYSDHSCWVFPLTHWRHSGSSNVRPETRVKAVLQRTTTCSSLGPVSLACGRCDTCVHVGTRASSSVACDWRWESIRCIDDKGPQCHPAPSAVSALDQKTPFQRRTRFHGRIACGTWRYVDFNTGHSISKAGHLYHTKSESQDHKITTNIPEGAVLELKPFTRLTSVAKSLLGLTCVAYPLWRVLVAFVS